MRRRSEDRTDRGSSLIEVVLAATLIGTLSIAIAVTSSTAASTSRHALDVLAATRDADRIRWHIPRDLEAYGNVDTSPDALSHLPGTNAFTLTPGTQDLADGAPRIVSYRYLQRDGTWQLVRYRMDDEQSTPEPSTGTVIASRLTPPDSRWTQGHSVEHAVEVSASLDGHVVDVVLDSGTRVRTRATTADIPTMPPTTPSTTPADVPIARCGGSISIVVNTSSAIWSRGSASTVTGQLSSFAVGLRGTPTHVRIVAFDRGAYSFYPEVSGGTSLNIVDPTASLTALNSKLTTLSTTSASWRNGRNWEDGLWQATRQTTGQLLAQPPDLIVFVTDGSPNRNRTNLSTDTDTAFHAADLSRAVAAADYARSTGSSLLGILMGNGSNETAAGHLRSVFGPTSWDASNDVLPADRSSVFIRPSTEGFARFADVLGLIAQWRCGGTVTLHQRVLTGGTAVRLPGTWSLTVSSDESARTTAVRIIPDRPFASVDLGIGSPDRIRQVSVAQDVRPGFRHLSTVCTRAGTSIPVVTTTDAAGRTTDQISIAASDIVTCVLTSESVQ